MELSYYLNKAIKEFGVDILLNLKLINILNDYNAFKNNMAAKLVLRTVIDSNYMERFLKIGEYNTSAQLLIDNFSNEFGFKYENVQFIFRSIAISLKWNVNSLDSYKISSQLTVNIDKTYLIDETLNLLKEGCIFCKKDNQITLLSLDGKKSIPSIIPYDYQAITNNGILITKSAVFGYEPYDLFYCMECNGGLVQPKYSNKLPAECKDWFSYIKNYGYNNNGMISFNKETIIPFKYNFIKEISPDGIFYAEKELSDESKAELLNLKGETILDNIYVDKWRGHMDLLKHGIVEKRDNEVTSYFNISGEIIFQNFDHITYSEDGKYINVTKNKKSGVADEKGNIIIPTIFDYCFIFEICNLIEAKLGGKYGLFNTKGDSVTSFEYDDMTIYQEYSIIIVKKGELYGALNIQGTEIIPCEFEELKIRIGGPICVQENDCSGKYGVFDHEFDSGPFEEGRKIIPYIFNSHKIYYAVIAKKNGKYGMYEFNGRKIVDCIYKELTPCVNGTAKFSDDKCQGIISSHDKELFRTSFKYRFIQPFAINNRFIAALDGLNDKWGLLDARGNEVTEFIYDHLEHISNGLIKASQKIKTQSIYNNTYYLHGLINSYGDIILPLKYQDITCISDKLFEIDIDNNKHFCCNENGIKVIDDFEKRLIFNNLIFIGRKNDTSKQDECSNTEYKYQIFDKTGNLKSTTVYDEIGDEYQTDFILGLLKVSRNGKFGFIDEQGIEIIPCIFDDVRTPIKIN